jgi:hypothetical protein
MTSDRFRDVAPIFRVPKSSAALGSEDKDLGMADESPKIQPGRGGDSAPGWGLKQHDMHSLW